SEMALTQLIPQDALPESFRLLAMAEESTQGMNATKAALEQISGDADIGTVTAAKGIYKFEGDSYDAYVFAIRAEDAGGATNAVTNYLARDKFKNDVKPVGSTSTTSRFAETTVNGHKVTEIRVQTPDMKHIKYQYVWSTEDVAFIVSGNTDRMATLELARLTGY
ncbi:MAG: hypothetical protein KAH86_01875, partial [Methanosarcinales archaeon]|nr:hypothetical protein [Methanosarcinales archaeon]